MRKLPRFYPIADAGLLSRREMDLAAFAQELKAAGAELAQYRDKRGSAALIAKNVGLLRSIFLHPECALILNDHVELAALTDCDGAHLGQSDLSPERTRKILGAGRLIGISTHNEEQVAAADAGPADYIAIGPVFSTSSKANPDPVIGLQGVRRLRALTTKPLVAIGGITRGNCNAAMDAGADSVAVISELLSSTGESVEKVTGDFLRLLR